MPGISNSSEMMPGLQMVQALAILAAVLARVEAGAEARRNCGLTRKLKQRLKKKPAGLARRLEIKTCQHCCTRGGWRSLLAQQPQQQVPEINPCQQQHGRCCETSSYLTD